MTIANPRDGVDPVLQTFAVATTQVANSMVPLKHFISKVMWPRLNLILLYARIATPRSSTLRDRLAAPPAPALLGDEPSR